MKNLEIGDIDRTDGMSIHMLDDWDTIEIAIRRGSEMGIVQLNPDEVRMVLSWLENWLTERQI